MLRLPVVVLLLSVFHLTNWDPRTYRSRKQDQGHSSGQSLASPDDGGLAAQGAQIK